MTWKIIRVLEGRCLFGMHLHVKERFTVRLLADLILFTQLSAMCETAAKRIDYQARLQFRFFLNVFNCLLTTNLSRRNNRSRTGPQTLLTFEGTATDSEFPLNSTFIHAILLLPEMFTRPRQDANDLFFILRP